MFNIWLDYPSFDEEIEIVRSTTQDKIPEPQIILEADEILFFQKLIRKVPVSDNVYKYAVDLATKTRPRIKESHVMANDYLTWGAGPRASQYLILGAICHAVLNGKYSPDIEDIQAVAIPVLRHRIIRNYKAEAEGINVEKIIRELIK
jgi:MoxR-like ATPase